MGLALPIGLGVAGVTCLGASYAFRKDPRAGLPALAIGAGCIVGAGWLGSKELAKPFIDLKAEYWSELIGIKTYYKPGTKLPIADGSKFGAKISFSSKRLGNYLVGFYCVVEDKPVWAGPVKVYTIPATTTTVEVEGVFAKGGLDHCRLIDTVKVIAGEEGAVVLEDADRDCFHIVTHAETKELRANYYFSDLESREGAGKRVPIIVGSNFGAEMRFDYRYFGGNFTILSELNIEGFPERSFVDFTLPSTRDWAEVIVKTQNVDPFDPRGLGHCRLIDVRNQLIYRGDDWSLWDTLIEDWDKECFHLIGAKRPGDKCGAILRFNHKGPAERVWIGFGIGPGHQNPITIPAKAWIGNWFNIDAHPEPTLCEAKVEGIFPDGFTPDTKVDVNKIIHTEAPPYTAEVYARRYDDDWDDEIYPVVGE